MLGRHQYDWYFTPSLSPKKVKKKEKQLTEIKIKSTTNLTLHFSLIFLSFFFLQGQLYVHGLGACDLGPAFQIHDVFFSFHFFFYYQNKEKKNSTTLNTHLSG